MKLEKESKIWGAEVLRSLANNTMVTNINKFRDALLNSHLNTGLNTRDQADPYELLGILIKLLDLKRPFEETIERQISNPDGVIFSEETDFFEGDHLIHIDNAEINSLESALDYFTTPIPSVRYDSLLECSKFNTAPETLPLILNRNIGHKKRSKKQLTIPMELTLSSKMFTNPDERDVKYHLKSAVCRIGKDAAGGHYVSYRINSKGEWNCYNDQRCSTVSKADLKKALEVNGYMLCYEKD